ncbi:MAG: hypothetical protein FWF69_04220 [Firmicutes bacterium]|nr:hypothetical protein [Bacillota bacterium]
MPRGGRRRVAFRFYILVLLAVCLFGYGLYVAWDNLVLRTAVVEAGAAVSQYQADAVIARYEKPVSEESVTKITHYADEGQLVYKGNRIAAVYSGSSSQSDMSKLLSVRARIKASHKQLRATTYSDVELKRMNDKILEYAHELEKMVHGKRGNLLNLERLMASEMGRRQTLLRGRNASDQNLMNLYKEESTLEKKIDSWMTPFLAETDCIVSFYTDGYEGVLDVNDFDNITAAQVRGVLNGEAPALTAVQRGRTTVFRQVRPAGWYLLLISHDPNWKPVDGNAYKVQLTGFDDLVIDGVVTSSARSGNELLVRMTVGGDVRPVLNVRTAKAQVGEGQVSGLKVPLGARYMQGGQVGVVLVDNGGIFVPIDIVAMDGDYYIIRPQVPGALREGQKIRLF